MLSYLKNIILSSLFLTLLSQYCGPSDNRSCYEILNVSKDASFSEIHQAFWILSLKYDPDLSIEDDASTKFAKIETCFEILTDETLRTLHSSHK